VGQNSKTDLKRSHGREPFGLAYFGLVLFMVVYFARPEDWIPGLAGVPLAKIAGVIIMATLIFSFNHIRWRFPQEFTFLALLVAQLWLSVPFSPVWRGGAFNVMLDFTKVLPLVIVIYVAVRSMERFRWILFVQASSAALIAISSIAHAHASGGRLQGVVSGMYANSNDLAVSIDLSLPLCLALGLTTRSYWKKLAWSLAIVAMIYAVFLTASRAGAIALVVIAVVYLWQLGVNSRRRLHLLLIMPLTIIIIWLYAGNSLRNRFEHLSVDPTNNSRRTEASESAEQRKQLLFKSMQVTAQHPLFGIGPGNFEVISGVWHVTHNSYTQMSAEGGIPALLLYCLVFWRGVANLRSIRKYQNTQKGVPLFSIALQASLAAYFVGSFFASLAYQLFPFCLVAYTSALRFIVYRNRTVPSSGIKAKSDTRATSAEAENIHSVTHSCSVC
jgi:putative inorganic carbon (HCO3(-)) transporter